jgi:DNA-3-methyladenine glycosylase
VSRTAKTARLWAAPGPAEERRLRKGLAQAPAKAARWLLGKRLVRRRGRSLLLARIVETEAYLGEGDPAAHSFRGRTPRTEPLWGPPGTVYVYFIYGMHHCLNFAVDEEGVPGGVLIRAVEMMDESLDVSAGRGPGRLCRALDLDTRFSGRHVFEPEAILTLRDGPPPRHVGVSPRIGIRLAADRPLRFFDAKSPAVSRAGRVRPARAGSAPPREGRSPGAR